MENHSGGSVVALAEQLRDGGDAAFQIARCGEQRQHDECGAAIRTPLDSCQSPRSGRLFADKKLLCRKVGQQQRACDNDTRQTAACQKVAVSGGLVIALGLNIGDDRN